MDRIPALANFTQTEHFLSPNADRVKDEVIFRFLVLEPTRLDVRIVGPEPAEPTAPAAREVRRLAFEYPATGPQSFTWTGRDDADEVVPDGRYTVYLNDLPFRVEVDNSPPEIALEYLNPRVEAAAYKVLPGVFHCREIEALLDPIREKDVAVQLATVVGDQSWHVVDRHLKSWVLRSPAHDMRRGTDPVYVPETDASGLPVLDEGVPRVRRGRADQSIGWTRRTTCRSPPTRSTSFRPRTRPAIEARSQHRRRRKAYGCSEPSSSRPARAGHSCLSGLGGGHGGQWRVSGPERRFSGWAPSIRPRTRRASVSPSSPSGRTLDRSHSVLLEDCCGCRSTASTPGIDPTAAYRGRFLGHRDGGKLESGDLHLPSVRVDPSCFIRTTSLTMPSSPSARGSMCADLGEGTSGSGRGLG
jgi:hypothetical protein